jgi:hypothetical protein
MPVKTSALRDSDTLTDDSLKPIHDYLQSCITSLEIIVKKSKKSLWKRGQGKKQRDTEGEKKRGEMARELCISLQRGRESLGRPKIKLDREFLCFPQRHLGIQRLMMCIKTEKSRNEILRLGSAFKDTILSPLEAVVGGRKGEESLDYETLRTRFNEVEDQLRKVIEQNTPVAI